MSEAVERAQVIPDESRFPAVNAMAECGDCGWQGKPRQWWSVAQSDADKHNKKPCPTPPSLPASASGRA